MEGGLQKVHPPAKGYYSTPLAPAYSTGTVDGFLITLAPRGTSTTYSRTQPTSHTHGHFAGVVILVVY
jgi:hypothetical protein